jgi:sarcosine oxidase subunit beta
VERGLVGAANSVLTGGGIRQQLGTKPTIRLAQLSAPVWQDFGKRFGVDPLFRPVGYLFLARSTDQAATLAANVELQASLGVDSEFLEAAAIVSRWPALRGRGFLGASFRAADGWANQHRIVDGHARAVLAAGVDVRVGTEALAIETRAGRVTGVKTTDGRIEADPVLVATGAQVSSLLAPLGIDLPVPARRRELLLVGPRRPCHATCRGSSTSRTRSISGPIPLAGRSSVDRPRLDRRPRILSRSQSRGGRPAGRPRRYGI